MHYLQCCEVRHILTILRNYPALDLPHERGEGQTPPFCCQSNSACNVLWQLVASSPGGNGYWQRPAQHYRAIKLAKTLWPNQDLTTGGQGQRWPWGHSRRLHSGLQLFLGSHILPASVRRLIRLDYLPQMGGDRNRLVTEIQRWTTGPQTGRSKWNFSHQSPLGVVTKLKKPKYHWRVKC